MYALRNYLLTYYYYDNHFTSLWILSGTARVSWYEKCKTILRCWLGGRKGIWPVKKLSDGMLAWLAVWHEV